MSTSISFYRQYKTAIWMGLFVVPISLVGFWAIYSWVLPYSGYNLGTARLEIEGDGYVRAFEGGVIEGMTVFEAIQASSVAGNISFNYDLNDGKLVVGSFDGYTAGTASKSISFYLNTVEIGPEQLHSVLIKDGDVILVKIQ